MGRRCGGRMLVLLSGLLWLSGAAGQGTCPTACDRTVCQLGEDYRRINSAATHSLLASNNECWADSELKNLGELTVQQCAAQVASDPDCMWSGSGPGIFMHSSSHPSWGCRCCSPRAAAQAPDMPNDNWDLYKVESSGCPPDKCCHGCSRFGWCGGGKEWYEDGGVDCCGCAPANFDFWRQDGAGSYPNSCMGTSTSANSESAWWENQAATGSLSGEQVCEGRGLSKFECLDQGCCHWNEETESGPGKLWCEAQAEELGLDFRIETSVDYVPAGCFEVTTAGKKEVLFTYTCNDEDDFSCSEGRCLTYSARTECNVIQLTSHCWSSVGDSPCQSDPTALSSSMDSGTFHTMIDLYFPRLPEDLTPRTKELIVKSIAEATEVYCREDSGAFCDNEEPRGLSMEDFELVGVEHAAELPDAIPDSVEDVGGKMVNGNVCPEANIVIEDADYCNTGFPDYDHEGMICANDGSATQAYCSYDVGPKACARCSSERRANALTGKGPGGSEQLKLRALHERIMKNIAFGKLARAGQTRSLHRAVAAVPGAKPARRLLAAGSLIMYDVRHPFEERLELTLENLNARLRANDLPAATYLIVVEKDESFDSMLEGFCGVEEAAEVNKVKMMECLERNEMVFADQTFETEEDFCPYIQEMMSCQPKCVCKSPDFQEAVELMKAFLPYCDYKCGPPDEVPEEMMGYLMFGAVIGGSMVLVGFAYCCFCSAKGGPTAPKTPGPVSFSGPPAVTQFPSTGYPMAPQWDAPPPAYDPNPAGRVCSQCYTSLPVGAQFCPQCGARP